jgi:hypothetical protein
VAVAGGCGLLLGREVGPGAAHGEILGAGPRSRARFCSNSGSCGGLRRRSVELVWRLGKNKGEEENLTAAI